jgi:hypothetical protein
MVTIPKWYRKPWHWALQMSISQHLRPYAHPGAGRVNSVGTPSGNWVVGQLEYQPSIWLDKWWLWISIDFYGFCCWTNLKLVSTLRFFMIVLSHFAGVFWDFSSYPFFPWNSPRIPPQQSRWIRIRPRKCGPGLDCKSFLHGVFNSSHWWFKQNKGMGRFGNWAMKRALWITELGSKLKPLLIEHLRGLYQLQCLFYCWCHW